MAEREALHRPFNVNEPNAFRGILEALYRMVRDAPRVLGFSVNVKD